MALQPELPFFGTDAGYQRWQTELDVYRGELEKKIGAPIGAKVRLMLADFDRPFMGVLELVAGCSEKQPRLRVRGFALDFSIDEITSVQKLG